MTFREFISDRTGRLLGWIVFMVCTAAFLCATGTRTSIIFLAGMIWLLVFLGTQYVEFYRRRAYLQELEQILGGLDKKYLFYECIPKNRFLYERRLEDFYPKAARAMTSAVSDAKAAQQEYREYVESWVHEIKTPITAAQLICQHTDADTRWKLSCELSQIEAHVQRSLYYARSGSPEKDILIRKTSLEEIVSQALNEHQSLLIQSRIRVETKGLDQNVFTDRKWVIFILGQLLQNAVRYRKASAVITISAEPSEKQVQLIVSDNGIGILPHELPRVFDRGFTGSNGRLRPGSTGMGLYLCKRMSEALGTELSITSIPESGTTVTLSFPANLTKM